RTFRRATSRTHLAAQRGHGGDRDCLSREQVRGELSQARRDHRQPVTRPRLGILLCSASGFPFLVIELRVGAYLVLPFYLWADWPVKRGRAHLLFIAGYL